MKLSTRSRYGTRLILDMARHYNQGPVQLGEIAKRQDISLKYLEQIIRPLKKADYIKSFRGSKGGHILNKSPAEITVGEIVALLEGRSSVTRCVENPETCDRVDRCLARFVWIEASKAMFEKLQSFTFADLLALDRTVCRDGMTGSSEQA
jgi:Rrf2 family protein